MSNLIKRINRRIQMTATAYWEDLSFSRQLANYRLVDELCWRLHITSVSTIYHKKKDEWILNYLKDKLKFVIEKYRNDTFVGEKETNSPIWVCWWSGEEDAPALVKQCIKSIRNNAGEHPVNFITEKNYVKYLKIPDYILEKVASGKMCVANFTDYLRVSLLEKYGGLWLDATIFCTNTIPEEYFENSFFTCKSDPIESRYLSKFRWTSFCLGGWKGHVFYRFFKEALEEYWNNEDRSIDYLLVDYIIETAYRYLPAVKQCIDSVIPNNFHRDDLQDAMNAMLPAQEFWSVIHEDTLLYKLSWRETYSEKLFDGRQSVYGYFMDISL